MYTASTSSMAATNALFAFGGMTVCTENLSSGVVVVKSAKDEL